MAIDQAAEADSVQKLISAAQANIEPRYPDDLANHAGSVTASLARDRIESQPA